MPAYESGGTFPAYQPGPDTVVVQIGMGGIGCQRCGETMPHPTGRPDADAMAWHRKHQCEPSGPIEEIGD